MSTGDGWCPFATKRAVTTNNYDVGRGGKKVKAVVLHIAEGTLEGCFSTFNVPANLVSAHFCVGKQGEIHQYVSINDTAYGNGLRYSNGQWFTPPRANAPNGVPVTPTWVDIVAGVNPNAVTVSIEHEGHFQDPWTQAMYDANTRLLAWIASQTGLTYTAHHTLIGHMELNPIDRPNCPGPTVNYDKMAADANAASASVTTATTTATATGATTANVTTASATALSDLERAVQTEAQTHTWMPINTTAALYQFAQRNNLGYPQTDEFQFTVGADQHIGQVFNGGIVYVKVGDWGNVRWVKKP